MAPGIACTSQIFQQKEVSQLAEMMNSVSIRYGEKHLEAKNSFLRITSNFNKFSFCAVVIIIQFG